MLHLDGEPLKEGRPDPDCPRPCVLCDTHHHWLDECADEGDPIQVCKHCDAWRPYPDSDS